MVDLVIVRHGERAGTRERRYAGSTDVELTPRGYEQAERLAEWASEASLTAIYSSTLVRARETAAAAARANGLDVRMEPRLRELDFGEGEGLTEGEMAERFPEALQAFYADPAAHPLPGGEDPHAAVERGLAAVRDIAAAHPDGRVLVVMHTTLMRLMLCRFLGAPLGEYRRLFPLVRNCSLTELRYDGDRAAVLEFNTPVDGRRPA
jgi:broad specificity phosphatase PhoE